MAASDVVVVGGGINGVSTAFHLAEQGAQVTLLEKDFIAAGPTGSSSAIIRQHYSNEVTARMALRSLRVWQNFDDAVGGDCGYEQTGFLIGVQPADLDSLKQNIAFQQSLGIDTRFVTPEEMRAIVAHIDPKGLGGAAFEPEGGYCDPAAATNAFAEAAKRLGASIHTGVAVTAVRIENGAVAGLETTDGPIAASAVALIAGPWTPQLLQQLDVELPITVARIKIGLFRRPKSFALHPVTADFIAQVYCRPETGNLMLVGSISPEEADDVVHNPDEYNEKVSMDLLAGFGERAAQRYPEMRNGHLAGNYASLYDITPDWHPIMDAVPGYEGLFMCAGSSGHGFKLAPATGEMFAGLILNGKQPEGDINLFAFDRFVTGNEVRGKYEYSIVG